MGPQKTEQPNGGGLDHEIERARETEIELPPGFTASVMRRVKAAAESFSILTRWSRRSAASRFGNTQTSTGGGIVIKKVLIGTVAAAAIVLGMAYWTGYPPITNQGTEGTIGAAQRYQAKQMSDKDVVLGDAAAQKFLQSETFDRVMKNEKARNFLKKAAKDPEMRRALVDSHFITMMRNHSIAELFAEDNMVELMQHPEVLDAMQEMEFAKAVATDGFVEMLQRPALQTALGAKNAEAAMRAPGIVAMFREAGLSPQYAALMKSFDAELAGALTDMALLNALADAELGAAMTDMALRPALTNSELISWLSQADVAELFADGLFIDALTEPAFLDALVADGFQPAFASPAFEAALNQGR